MVERSLDVVRAAVLLEVVVREQHLPYLDAVAREEPLVLADEPRLSDGGAHLHVVDVGGARPEAERLDAGGDRAGRDEEHLVPGLPQRAQLRDEPGERGVVGLAGPVRDRMGSNLDDYSHRRDIIAHPAPSRGRTAVTGVTTGRR